MTRKIFDLSSRFLLFCLLAGSSLSSQEARDHLGEVLERAVAEHGISGLSARITLEEEALLSRGWGYAEPDRPASVTSRFRAGSFTAQLAAIAALQLVDAGHLDLDRDVMELLAELREPPVGDGDTIETVATPAGLDLRLRDLLQHTSGLRGDEEVWTPLAEQRFARGAVLEWLSDAPIESDPGSCFGYSRANLLALGTIVELATGSDLPSYLESHVFLPLGMENTGYAAEHPPIEAGAVVGQEILGVLEEERPGPQPFQAERLYTSAEDLACWTRALLDGELVPARLVELMTTSARSEEGAESGFGLGVNLQRLGPEESVSFGGAMAGGRLHVAHYPRLDLTLCLLAADGDAPLEAIERRLSRFVFGQPEEEPLDLSLSDEELARYVGTYYEACDRLDVVVRDRHLELHSPHPGEGVRLLLSQGHHRFVAADDPEIELVFEMRGERASGFVYSRRGVEHRGVRLQ